jgi:hypothetical protein
LFKKIPDIYINLTFITAAGPYSEPDEARPQYDTLFLLKIFLYYPPVYSCSFSTGDVNFYTSALDNFSCAITRPNRW